MSDETADSPETLPEAEGMPSDVVALKSRRSKKLKF